MADDEIDLETLQAQIDMSMAFTNNLVSGWMKTTNAKFPSSSTLCDDNKELEEYMRRPPRLGVGASIPEATGMLSRETAKLRNKLVENTKKRGREDDASSSAIVISEDDDEDSRGRVIRKKARLDPFAVKDKKDKDKKKAEPPSAQAKGKAANLEDVAKVKVAAVVEASHSFAPDVLPGGGVASPATRSKRKKKKKHKSRSGEGTQPDAADLQPGTADAAAVPAEKREVIVLADSPPPANASESPVITAAKLPPVSESISGQKPVSFLSISQETGPKSAAQSSTRRLVPSSIPLLNLSGPPPVPDEGDMESPKKKRKKKKKKKRKGVTYHSVQADVIDVDADADADGDEGEDD